MIVTECAGRLIVSLKYGSPLGTLDPIVKLPAGIITIPGIAVTHGANVG